MFPWGKVHLKNVRLYRRQFALFAFLGTFFLFILFAQQESIRKQSEITQKEKLLFNTQPKNEKFLIETTNCKIPNLDPFNADVKPYFDTELYKECATRPLLSYIRRRRRNGAELHINSTVIPEYVNVESNLLICCYANIERIRSDNKTDRAVRTSPCTPFNNQVTLTYPFVYVKCTTETGDLLYENVHATALLPNTQKSENTSKFSILLVGIDSMSKWNLMRTMPKTYNFLERSFVNLRGYNKVADNTFPNLMAILSGMSRKQVWDTCKMDSRPMENCSFLWDDVKAVGYTTAYAEDECSISTFNYMNWGFVNAPTDLYYRPYMLAAEKLKLREFYRMSYCTGPETSGERILNAAKDFAVNLFDLPTFGLFWMNSFSHENINFASTMDLKVFEFLSDEEFSESVKNTFFVVFSDHGFRFGDYRYTHSGWLEERLPFIYVKLPAEFHIRFPTEYDAFRLNAKRLTTPYDLFMTLQHVVELTDGKFVGKESKACPKCASFFKHLPENRACSDAGVEQHWCTCKMHNFMHPKDERLIPVADYVLAQIHGTIKSFRNESELCARFKLNRVVSAGRSDWYLNEFNQKVNYFLVIFETVPMAMFEATVEEAENAAGDRFRLLGDISRISKYSENSYCVKNGGLKKYCFCDGIFTKIKSAFCVLFNYCI